MNIQTVIEYLKKEYGYDINGSYYSHIADWRRWWEGYNKEFHHYRELSADGITRDRKLYSLRMAKKVCEDWAAILLNEKTEIIVGDEATSRYLLGAHDNETTAVDVAGVLDQNDFWNKANELIEKACYSGTGAFVLRFDGMVERNGRIVPDGETKTYIEYLPAENIIPLTIRRGSVVEVAFASEVMERGKKYVYIEMHTLEGDGYKITNQYFTEDEGSLKREELPDGIVETFVTGSPIPLFSIIKPNIVNNIDPGSALGISVFANAIDELIGVDLAYNNFNRDFKLGGKKVFVRDDIVKMDNAGNTITPDDVAQQLFVTTGDGLIDKNGNKAIEEYNPSLRVAENKDGVQAQLDYLSFKVGFGTKHYQFNAGQIVTATQYMGDKQELVQNASKHYINVDKALKSLVRAILWAGKYIANQPINPEAKITVKFDDSYIIDKESERARDLQEIDRGIMQKWEYRVKWYGEDEETAKSLVQKDDIGAYFGGA